MRALIIVDVQRDFLPGGALPAPKGDEVIPVINALLDRYDLIVASKDWHPSDHTSFHSQGGPFPPHCIQGSEGAAFGKGLETDKIKKTFFKGTEKKRDAFSAFEGTELNTYLHNLNVDEVDIVGLATDYCVKATALDASRLGFKVRVLAAGCRGIGAEKLALQEMEGKGVIIC
ncbi:MAG: Nicotinamidase [Chlamydiales bacterium]|nr:Nicotinamidase [Chlamydiales bacterium]MCH9620400.1 Nicotinamidase [Chlamydiales bacterium]MCH9622954.1 Nicotinamidase [Chlamydiales bacterium]